MIKDIRVFSWSYVRGSQYFTISIMSCWLVIALSSYLSIMVGYLVLVLGILMKQIII